MAKPLVPDELFVTEKAEENKFGLFNPGMALIAFREPRPNAFC